MNKEFCRRFLQFLKAKGLRETQQRRRVLEILCQAVGHPSAEDILAIARQDDPGLSISTIYRTLNLLLEAGLIEAHNYRDGSTRFEIKRDADQHDHLICVSCGEVVEVSDEDLGWLQERMADQHGYILVDRRMYLYGLCPQCQADEVAGSQKGGSSAAARDRLKSG